jgi:RNA polymerase sigma-70 factor (ECF subfamily)
VARSVSSASMNRSAWSVAQLGVGTPDRTDEELLAAVAERDRGAFRELYNRHEPWLVPRLARRCSDGGVVEEVVQDTFLAVWRSASRYEGRGEVAAWVWGIAVRTLLRQIRPRRPLLARLQAQRRDDRLVSAEDELLLRVEHGELGPALGTLSPELRAVVQATVLDGLTTREAAALLGIPAGTVKTRMQRARFHLREALS